jgi:hypothetical protein
VLAWLLLVMHAGSWMHQLLVIHTTCAAHGEQVHVREGTPQPEALLAGSGAATGGEADYLARGRAAETHGHEHCLGVVQRRDVLASREAAVCQELARPSTVDVTWRKLPARVPRFPLHLLAPKSSPPALG